MSIKFNDSLLTLAKLFFLCLPKDRFYCSCSWMLSYSAERFKEERKFYIVISHTFTSYICKSYIFTSYIFTSYVWIPYTFISYNFRSYIFTPYVCRSYICRCKGFDAFIWHAWCERFLFWPLWPDPHLQASSQLVRNPCKKSFRLRLLEICCCTFRIWQLHRNLDFRRGLFSLHLCMGFLFLILYPAASSSASSASSPPPRHPPFFISIFVTYHLSHTIFVTYLSHTNFLIHYLSHTTLSDTIFHTQLCQTLSFTHNFVRHHLSHTTSSHTILHT